MNQSLITKIGNVAIYLINDKNISYYLSIPISSTQKNNIALNITTNLDNNTVLNVSKNFDNQNFCIISPIFDENTSLQNEQHYIYIDKYISYLINNVYKMLNSNNREVDSKIFLIKNNSCQEFTIWFLNKYKDRVELIDCNSRTANSLNSNPFMQSEMNTSTVNIPVVDTEKEQKASSVLDNTQDIVTDSTNTISDEKDLGFVSYVLLGVVVAVVSLAILYLLI